MEMLPLPMLNGANLKIRDERFVNTKEELETFLSDKKHLHTRVFAKDVMFSHELKANNQIEGINDDVKLIRDIIEKRYPNPHSEQAMRVLNLYHGYNYILKNRPINQKHLQHLYKILSKNLLDPRDAIRMGEYYRTAPVYILIGGNLCNYEEGIPEDRIDEFMNHYFDFLNNYSKGNLLTDEFIKSQILHFYFVYIHPYFDVNGRTSRTLSMWYLLNKKAYPYIIFNRGIAFKGSNYDKTIIDVKKYHDISYFIEFMLQTVQEELEKEYIMQSIQGATSEKLTGEDYQTLLYLLSMNGLITVNDFCYMYNRFHDKRKRQYIYENMIDPLKQKGILKVVRTTNHPMFNDVANEVLEINPSLLEYNKDDINRLVRFK